MCYLTLRYVLGVVDAELPTAIGMQMMCAFMNLGNSFAFSFLRYVALKLDTAMRQGAKVNIIINGFGPCGSENVSCDFPIH